MTLTLLPTAIDVLDALGGLPAVASLTSSTAKAVSNWKSFGKFPSNTYVAMIAALHTRGFDAPSELWAMKHGDGVPPLRRHSPDCRGRHNAT